MDKYIFKLEVTTDKFGTVIDTLNWVLKQEGSNKEGSRIIMHALTMLCEGIEIMSITKKEV